MEFGLLIASTIAFVLACVTSWKALRKQRRASAWFRIGFMAVGFALQCAFLYLRGQTLGKCPLTSGFEILIFVSWSIALIYFLVGGGFRLSLLGFFTAPLIVIFQGVALLLFHPANVPAVDAGLGHADYWVEFHAALALISYGAFALAFVAGVMFLIQDRNLRAGRTGMFFHQLPPVHYLIQAIGRLLWLGFLLLTVGILAAFKMERFPESYKLIAISVVWLAYGVVIAMRVVRSLGGRRLATLAVGAFVFPILSCLFL
jgi:ABC-type uncharacterized transport system permease subunit